MCLLDLNNLILEFLYLEALMTFHPTVYCRIVKSTPNRKVPVQ